MLQPGPAPGREPGAQPAPPPAPGTAAPGNGPTPTAPPPGGGGLLGNLTVMLPLILMVVVLFVMTRADRKKRAQLESKLKKGDRVVTRSGLIGKLVEVSERTVKVEIAPGVHVSMMKNAIEGLEGGETITGKTTEPKEEESKKKK